MVSTRAQRPSGPACTPTAPAKRKRSTSSPSANRTTTSVAPASVTGPARCSSTTASGRRGGTGAIGVGDAAAAVSVAVGTAGAVGSTVSAVSGRSSTAPPSAGVGRLPSPVQAASPTTRPSASSARATREHDARAGAADDGRPTAGWGWGRGRPTAGLTSRTYPHRARQVDGQRQDRRATPATAEGGAQALASRWWPRGSLRVATRRGRVEQGVDRWGIWTGEQSPSSW